MQSVHEQRIRVGDPAVLARYLPAAVVSHLLDAEGAPATTLNLDAHIARLQELLQLVVSYVPEHVAEAQSALPTLRAGHLSRSRGTLLSADLSGFTAFSAHLSTLGSEGAELVARTISDLFSSLLAGLAEWRGSLLKLSGDALTALFCDAEHERRAVAAAIDLQARMAAFQELATPAGVFTLRMRIGLASGDVLLVEVGTRERIELLVAGATARRVVEVQRQAPPGAVVVAGSTYQEIAPVCQALTVAAGLYRARSIIAPARPKPQPPRRWIARRDSSWELHALVARLEALRPYLVDQHLARLVAGPPSLIGEGDLRPVTVLFACLSDSGPLLDRAAPGDNDAAPAQLLANAQRICEIVDRHGGTINKIDLHPDGHTLVALFGAPVAQGRDAERAVNCALALLSECPARRAPDSSEAVAPPLTVRRVGIATGQVFAGAVGSAQRREYTVMGSTVNLAARLMDSAEEGQVLIGPLTAQVVWRWFRLLELPPMAIKGYDEPISFYLVGAEQRSRLSSMLREHGPLVGRQAELALAQACAAGALGGSGAIVALVGEAGIGKSRLLSAIMRTALVEAAAMSAADPAIIVVQTHPYGRGRPYAVIADLLRQLYALPEQPGQAAEAIASHVYERTPEYARFLPLLLVMLGLPGEESLITHALTLEERRAKLHDLVVALLTAYAHSRPTALVLEDLHWADAASLELLGVLAAAIRELPVLLLCTYRPDETPPWPDDANVIPITLQGLTPDQSWELLGERLAGLALPDELRAAAVERTQGNPFFIEETARALRERGLDTHSAPPLPTTVQGALLARLDRLPTEERYVLQIASVIGPVFQPTLLEHLTLGQVSLEPTLEHLAERGLLRVDGDGERYAFAHSLTQETAYESLLFAQRRDLHRQVADRLRVGDPACADEEPGLLAFHYRRAEAWEDVLEFSWRAGARAQTLYAGDLALSHYQSALEAADRLDSAPAQRRSVVLKRCGDVHALAGRYAEAVAAYRAAMASCDDDPQCAEILICWAEVCEQQAAYTDALVLLDQAATLLAQRPEDALALRISVRRGWILVRQGAADEAREAVEPHLDQLEMQERWADLLLAYKVFFHIAAGQCRWSEARAYLRLALASAERAGDIREIARIHNNLGVVLVQEGNLRQATVSCERCARVMEEIGDRYNLALIKINTGVIYYKLGDVATALDCYYVALRIATEIGAPLAEASARINLGESYRQLGQLEDSLDHLLRSADLCGQMRDDLGLVEAYRQLAETYIALERLDEATDACEQARATALAVGERQGEAIAYRVRGMLAMARGDYDTALGEVLRSIKMLSELGSTQELGQSMILQATILMHEGQAEAACAILEEVILLLRKIGAVADVAYAERLLATTHTHAPVEEMQL